MSESIETKAAQKLDFSVLGNPVKVRVYGDSAQARAEISGLDLSVPLTSDQLFDLSIWLQQVANAVSDYEDGRL